MPNSPSSEPAPSRFGRRTFLAAGAGALAALGTGLYLLSESDDEREARLGSTDPDDFPEEFQPLIGRLPGVREARIHRFGNAQRHLVHVRQVHRIENMTPDQERRMREVQSDIETSLGFFMDHPEIRLQEVLNEGTSPEIEAFLGAIIQLDRTNRKTDEMLDQFELEDREARRQMLQFDIRSIELDLRSELALALRFGDDPEKIAAGRRQLEQTLAQKRRDLETLLRHVPAPRQPAPDRLGHAVDRLARDRNLRVRSSETFEANVRASLAAEKAQKGNLSRQEFQQLILENRERIAVRYAGARPGRFVFVVYGAAHRFRRMVEEWNAAHPNVAEQFNLIELTPTQYQ